MPHQRRAQQGAPVVLEVLPQTEARKVEQSQMDGVLDTERQLVAGDRLTGRRECRGDVDTRVVGHRVREAGDLDPQVDPQSLEERMVGGGGAGVVQDEFVVAAPRLRAGTDRDGDEDQRRAQRLPIGLPHERAEGEVQVVRPGLLDDGACGVRELHEAAGVRLLAQGDGHATSVGQCFTERGRIGLDAVADSAPALNCCEPVVRVELEDHAVMDHVLEGAQQFLGHREREGRPRGEVDQPIAQAEVEQFTLPLLDTRGDVCVARDPPGPVGDLLAHQCREVSFAGAVLALDDRTVRVAAADGEREDTRAAGGLHLDDGDDLILGTAEVPPLVRVVERAEARVVGPGGEHRGLDELDVARTDVVGRMGEVGDGAGPPGGFRAPVAHEDVPLGEPELDVDPHVLQRRREEDGEVEAGATPVLQDLLCGTDPLGDADPARGRVGVGDASRVQRTADGVDDLVGALSLSLIGVQGVRPGRCAQDLGGLRDEGADSRLLRAHEGGEETQVLRVVGRGESPAVRAEDVDGPRLGDVLGHPHGAGVPSGTQVDTELGLRRDLDVEHLGAVEDEADGGGDRLTGVEGDDPVAGHRECLLPRHKSRTHPERRDGLVRPGDGDPHGDGRLVVGEGVGDHVEVGIHLHRQRGECGPRSAPLLLLCFLRHGGARPGGPRLDGLGLDGDGRVPLDGDGGRGLGALGHAVRHGLRRRVTGPATVGDVLKEVGAQLRDLGDRCLYVDLFEESPGLDQCVEHEVVIDPAGLGVRESVAHLGDLTSAILGGLGDADDGAPLEGHVEELQLGLRIGEVIARGGDPVPSRRIAEERLPPLRHAGAFQLVPYEWFEMPRQDIEKSP